MTVSSLPLAADGLAALDDFLRGIERRAAVFAELACGDPERGDAAIQAAVHGFCRAAARGPLADWDVCFWGLLLASPQLRRDAGDGRWSAPWTRLAELGPGVRSALLLQVVAGLDDGQIAAALGIAPATAALAVQRALGERGSPAASPRWQAYSVASRQQLRQLAGERLLRLARIRGDALRGRMPKRGWQRRGAHRPLLWAALATCILAFAASFLLPAPVDDATADMRTTALPSADPPLEQFDADTALLTHRDFDQLTAPPAQRSLASELEFYAWYAAASSDGGAPPGTPAAGGTHASR